MNSMTMRIAAAAVILVILFGAAWFTVYKGGIYKDIRDLDKPISTIPMQLKGWKGTDVPVDEELFKAIDAKEVVSRNYTNPLADRDISLHSALFVQFWRWLPHKPWLCYVGNGWTIIKREPFELTRADGTKARAELIHFEKEHAKIFVLCWYEFGNHVLVEADDFYYARKDYRDDETWPPILKVMLQISADRPEKAMEQLTEFANALFQYTQTLQ